MPTTIGAGASWLGSAIGGTAAAGAGTAAGAAAGTGLGTALASAAVTAAVGALASKALTPKQQEQTVKPVSQAEKPQEAKAVDYNAIKDKNALAAAASGMLSGNGSTLLTGSSGVNPGSLNLGVNTLLGS